MCIIVRDPVVVAVLVSFMAQARMGTPLPPPATSSLGKGENGGDSDGNRFDVDAADEPGATS